MSAVPLGEIAGRRESILEAIARAAAKAGRRAEDVALMAVTKGHGVETVRKVASVGLRGIALEAGGALIVNRPAVIAEADAAKVFVLGYERRAGA